MANITCAISGLRFRIAGLEGTEIPASTGYYHPVFTLSHKKLYNLYYQHTRNKLTPVDSYLLFCAFLQSRKSRLSPRLFSSIPLSASSLQKRLIKRPRLSANRVRSRTCISMPSPFLFCSRVETRQQATTWVFCGMKASRHYFYQIGSRFVERRPTTPI